MPIQIILILILLRIHIKRKELIFYLGFFNGKRIWLSCLLKSFPVKSSSVLYCKNVDFFIFNLRIYKQMWMICFYILLSENFIWSFKIVSFIYTIFKKLIIITWHLRIWRFLCYVGQIFLFLLTKRLFGHASNICHKLWFLDLWLNFFFIIWYLINLSSLLCLNLHFWLNHILLFWNIKLFAWL